LLFESWVSDKLIHVVFTKNLGPAQPYGVTGLTLTVNGSPVPLTSFFHPLPTNPHAFAFAESAAPAPGQTVRLQYDGSNPVLLYGDSSPVKAFDVSGTS